MCYAKDTTNTELCVLDIFSVFYVNFPNVWNKDRTATEQVISWNKNCVDWAIDRASRKHPFSECAMKSQLMYTNWLRAHSVGYVIILKQSIYTKELYSP